MTDQNCTFIGRYVDNSLVGKAVLRHREATETIAGVVEVFRLARLVSETTMGSLAAAKDVLLQCLLVKLPQFRMQGLFICAWCVCVCVFVESNYELAELARRAK